MFSLPLGRRRLATLLDASAIYDLVNEPMSKNFRVRDVKDVNTLIESSTLAIVHLNDRNSIVGFLAAKDHPLLPSVHPSAWEHYVWTKYKTPDLTARNTLFIHLLCWNRTYSGRDIVDNLLRSMYLHDAYLMNICMIKNLPKYPLLMPGQSRCEGSFRRVATSERGVPSDILPVLLIADRAEVCPRLRIRRAVEEDNDDLVPIIEQHSSRLREIYGEFYISELISRHPESERVLLVGEHKELAVGVMILNTVINYEALEESYDLSPFAGLRHLDAKPSHTVQFTRISSDALLDNGKGPISVPASAPSSAPLSTNASALNVPAEDKPDNPLKLSWQNEVDQTEELAPKKSYDEHPVIFSLDDDDDEIDFDIVNIDHNLLRIPRPLSVELNIEFLITDEISGTKDVMAALQDKLDNTKLKKLGPVASDLRASMQGQFEVVRYSGKPNAFLLEVFAMHPDYDERHGFDILQVTFELFPDRDYIVLCLPSNQPAFPLLEHFTLVAPKHNREKFTNQSLYVAHINSVREHVAVRSAEPYDLPAMNHVLEHVSDRQHVLQLLEKSFRTDHLDSFVLLSQNQAVGVVILGSLDNCVGVRTQYDLEPEPRSFDADGEIVAGILSPALGPHARWYLRDIIRRSRFTHLFWQNQHVVKGSLTSRNVMSLTGRLVPVAPHRRCVPNITGVKNLDNVWTPSSHFALWAIDTCLTALPKVDVNCAIVVVGASRTGLAFIETLLIGPASRYLTFTNITLVSEHGLPMLADCMPAAETCVPKGGRYTDHYLKSIPIHYYVDCITGVVTGIDRKKKCIRLKKGIVKYYDDLVLTCGLQFQHPDYLAESFAHSKKMSKGKPCERMLMDNPKYQPDRVPSLPDLPENVFVINSLYEANVCLKKLLKMIHNPPRDGHLSCENRVIVYGDYVESYTAMAALLEIGLTPLQIAFVEPFPPSEPNAMRVNCFNDEIIDERVQTRINELGIYVYRQCHFTSWRWKGSRIYGIDVMSPLKSIFIPCFALFYYGLKAINYHALKAIIECGLVYDGGLIVDPTFKSNDPHVYGAGRGVQYSRRLRAERKLLRHCCSEDVGEALANIFLHNMDPFVMADKEADLSELLPRYRSSLLNRFPHPSIDPLLRPSLEKNRKLAEGKDVAYGGVSSPRRCLFTLDLKVDGLYELGNIDDGTVNYYDDGRFKWEPVMEFQSPVSYWATLPGPLYYMRLRAPGEEIPMEVRLTLPHQGHTLTTDKNGNYLELRLNEFHCIDAITCLARKTPPYDLLGSIYGIHESMFNKLLARYTMNKIDDFYEFFMQPWMSAVYLDAFGNMLRLICRQNVGTIFDLIKSHFALELPNDDTIGKDMDDIVIKSSSSPSSSTISCLTASSCIIDSGEIPILGSIHSVIERFLKPRMASDEKTEDDLHRHFPSECGQSELLRSEAKAFWNAMGGERIVTAHLARFLERNFVPNPHYAKIRPNLI